MEEERFEVFSTLISGIHGNIKKLKTRYMTQLGLKSVHIFWLYLLRAHPEGLSASQLAAAGKTNRSLVSRELSYLIEAKMIRIPQGERRRYGWKLTLTEKGAKVADNIASIARNVQNTVSRNIPKEDLTVFYRTLYTLNHNFEKLTNRSPEHER